MPGCVSWQDLLLSASLVKLFGLVMEDAQVGWRDVVFVTESGVRQPTDTKQMMLTASSVHHTLLC